MKNAKIFLIPVLMIFLLSAVSFVSAANSVTISLFYDSTGSNSLTITEGDEFGIALSADSIFENSMTIKLNLLNSNKDVVANLLDVYTSADSYFKHLTIGKTIYSTVGDYILKAEVIGASGNSAVDELILKVTSSASPINKFPVITSTPITSINEGQSYVYQVIATDSDGDVLTYSLTQAPNWLSINSGTGRITGTAPNVNADTAYSVTIRVSDGKGGIATQSFSLTVKDITIIPPVNSAPVIISTPLLSMYEGNMYIYDVIATDADRDTLTYSLTQAPSWLSINSLTGRISGLTPQVNADTSYPITIRVSDGKGGIATQTYTFIVRNDIYQGNHDPRIMSNPVLQVNEGEAYAYRVNAIDIDGDVLIYSLTTAPSWLKMDLGLISGIAPYVNVDTDYQIIIRISDGKNGVAIQSYILKVKNVVPTPPADTTPPILTVISPVNGQTYTLNQISLEFTTNEDITSAWYVLDNSGNSQINRAPNSYRHFIDSTQSLSNGEHTITFYARDLAQNLGQTSKITFYVNVISPPANNAPVIISTPITSINEGQSYVYQVIATDADGDVLTYSLTQAPNWLSINSGTGRITGTAPNVNADTTYPISIRVSDGKGGNVLQSFVLTVFDIPVIPPTNSAPIITSTPITSINEGQSYVYQVIATDADGDVLTYSLTQNPSWLTINSGTGRITGTAPQVNADTAYSVTIRVSDGRGGNVLQSYSLTVINIPSTPTTPGGSGTSTNKKSGVKYLVDKKGQDKYLSQFEFESEKEEQKIILINKQQNLSSQIFWIGIVATGILIIFVFVIILSRRGR
jgi:predicted small secreted protein